MAERRAGGGKPLRIGPRALAIAGFAFLILVGLSGAFLLGLAAVGVLAGLLAAFELVRRQLHPRSRIAVLDQRTAG
jgi:hypothetical protein